jgi:cyclohexadienyl dehydratase
VPRRWILALKRGGAPRRTLVAALAAGALLFAAPGSGREAESEAAPLRIGTSGDYPPFSRETHPDSGEYEGFDIALARAYAADRELALEFVRFRWPRLTADLRADRFDVAMSGITVRPERSAAGRFTHAVTESGAVVLMIDRDRFRELHQLDHPHIRIGVNAGGHLERVARRQFPSATLVAIPDNISVLRALREEKVDAAVSDSLEARIWAEDEAEFPRLGPFTRDRKAFLVRADRADLAADLDAWLLARERDGTLERLRREHLGATGAAAMAAPLPALIAAVDERLALMPLVAVVKRRSGVPLEVPERESFVLDAASTAVLEAAQRRDAVPPSFLDIRAFFRALLDVAKEVQWKASRDPTFEPETPLPDLDGALRPALERIGERIAQTIVELPGDLDRAAVRAAVGDGIRTPRVSDASKRAIADAIAALGSTDGAAEPDRAAAQRRDPSAASPEARQ